MSEFKFACPVCGQHITADSSASGTRLDCPTCFRPIVVPYPSGSADSKFVLSAMEANRARPATRAPGSPPVPRRKESRLHTLIPFVPALLLVAAVGASLYFFRDRLFSGSAAPVIQTDLQPSDDSIAWMLDLANTPIPDKSALGKIMGHDFVCDGATLQNGALNLRMGAEPSPQITVSVDLYARRASILSGKSALVSTNNIRSPRITLMWREGPEDRTVTFSTGFALKLEFGVENAGQLPGKIYLCLPDPLKSRVAGTFVAEIRASSKRNNAAH